MPRLLLLALLLLSARGEVSAQAEATLEQGRRGEVAAWSLVLRSAKGPQLARALRGLGRVADLRLKGLLSAWLHEQARSADADLQRAEALAVGLFGDPELLLPLAARVTSADLARAVGLVGKLPEAAAARETILAALRAAGPPAGASGPAGIITDPVVARLTYGMRLSEPLFLDLALATLKGKSPLNRVRAATYYLARQEQRPPPAAARLLAGQLRSGDSETAAYAARALARIAGGQGPAAALISQAFLAGGPRVAQIDRLRALGKCAPGPARQALLAALKSDDPHLRRVALESAGSLAPRMEPGDLRGLATFAVTMAEVDPQLDVRAAAVGALAALDSKGFLRGLARYRLASPWQLRAAAAAALGRLDWKSDQVRHFAQLFAKDPDRRVRQDLLAAVTSKVRSQSDAAPAFWISELWCPWDLDEGLGEHAPGTIILRAPTSHDPVELGLLADLVLALTKTWKQSFPAGVDHDDFLRPLARRLPLGEIEPWQFVLKLAAGVGGKVALGILKQAAVCNEIALRRLARSLLARAGLEQPPKTSRAPSYQAAWRRSQQKRSPSGEPAPELPRPGSAAIIRTLKGDIHLRLFWEDAPVTCSNFVRLAQAGHFDGLLFHRVVPGFVAQAGCPRGDGFGGPGYTIPCENSDRTYVRGSLGMALAGKDTGGSQWFLCHRPAPHLDGRYTLFGEISQGLEVLDALNQGDLITSLEVLPPRQR